MNYIDLFSGIGGFALGAYWAGMKFENHYFSEVEPYCVELYQKRFPDAIPLGDIREIDCEKLMADTESREDNQREPGDVDEAKGCGKGINATIGDSRENEWIITGGFPCQDISVAGKGAGIEGSRSGLWAEYWRIIREIRPRYAIIENVAALTFRGLDRVLSDLASIGYDAEWQDIRAEDVGAPHRRERIWIIAYPISEHDDDSGYGASEICGERSKASEVQECAPDARSEGLEGQEPESELSRGEPGLFAERDNGGWWAVESDVGRLAHGVPHRVDRLKGDGNAIVPEIAELLFRQIKDD